MSLSATSPLFHHLLNFETSLRTGQMIGTNESYEKPTLLKKLFNRNSSRDDEMQHQATVTQISQIDEKLEPGSIRKQNADHKPCHQHPVKDKPAADFRTTLPLNYLTNRLQFQVLENGKSIE